MVCFEDKECIEKGKSMEKDRVPRTGRVFRKGYKYGEIGISMEMKEEICKEWMDGEY